MSTKEQIITLINSFSEEQLESVLTVLQSLKNIADEAEDEAYCKKMYDEYKSNETELSQGTVSLDDFAKELGIAL